MEKGQRTSPLFLAPSIALILILVGNIFRHVAPESIRPPAKPASVQQDEKVPCRLWQDPYEVALDHYRKNKQPCDLNVLKDDNKKKQGILLSGPNALKNSNKESQGQQVSDPNIMEAGDKKIQGKRLYDLNPFYAIQKTLTSHTKVMFVMMRHRFTAEDCERRLRTRYAVLSAVNDSGYSPVDTENIQYVNYLPENASRGGQSSNSIILPYEWYKYDPVNRLKNNQVVKDRRLLIMWLPEYGFQNDPIMRLADIMEQISGDITDRPEFIFVGPTSSDVQFSIFKKVIKDEVISDAQEDCYKLAIYSPWSTADPTHLQVSLETNDGKTDITRYHWKATIEGMDKKGIELDFRRMIGTDDLLAKALIGELKKFRDIDPADPNVHIVLISEWDTRYGKIFPETFKERVRHSDKSPWPSNVHVYQYIRGLDGRVFDSTEQSSQNTSNSHSPEQADDSSMNALDHKKWIKNLKKPLGQSQIDYVERFVQGLTERYDRINAINAIGVVGSDVYDKILLLQALRQEFPQALYFTIDLDARLMHSECFDYTRNLIVASHYGLSLNEKRLQGGKMGGKIMQFRDNYQTSVFFACRSALSQCSENAPLNEIEKISSFSDINRLCPDALKELLSSPRIFEIGRNCAVDFSPKPSIIHPQLSFSKKSGKFKSSAIAVVLGLAVNVAFLVNLFVSFQDRWIKRVKFMCLIIVDISIVLLFVALDLSQCSGQESFSLTNGTSAWPNQCILLLGNLLTLWLIIKGWQQLEESKRSIEKDMYLSNQEFGVKLKSWLLDFFDRFRKKSEERRNCKDQHGLKGGVQIDKAWREYQFSGHICMRLCRSFLWILIIVFIFICKDKSTLQNSSFLYRGNIIQWVRVILKWPSILLGFFVIVFAGDAVWLCRRFISKISCHKSCFCELLNLHYSQLGRKSEERMVISQLFIIRVIAQETQVTRTLLYYPFVICFVMLMSLHNFFDNFTFPLWVAITAVVYLGFAIMCGCTLRVEAEKMRQRVLNRLDEKLIYYKSQGSSSDSMVKMIETTLAKVKEVTQGAFSPMIKDGYFGTLLLPTGGYSIFRIVEYFLTM